VQRSLLLDKNIYGVKYFIRDLSLLKYLNVESIQLFKVGATRRLELLFHAHNAKQYMFCKKKCMKEQSFVNMSIKTGMNCASFIADKKFNATIDMLINSRTLECVSKDRVLELCETL